MNFLLVVPRSNFKVCEHVISAWLAEIALQQNTPI